MKSKDELLREQLIEQAVLRAFEEDQQEYEQADTSALSPDFRERILQLADEPAAAKRPLSLHKRIVLLAAVLVMLICMTGMVAYPLISANIGHHKTENGNGTHIETYPTTSGVQNSIGVHYTLSEVPEGYREYWGINDQRHAIKLWEKEGSEWKQTISLMQSPAGSHLMLNTKGCTEEKVTVQGYVGWLYRRENYSCLFWVTDSCIFQMSISGEDAQTLDILAMANALIKVEVELNHDVIP